MPLYRVTTRSTVWRNYEVAASDVKEAIAKTCETQPLSEEDEDTETMSAELVHAAKSA